MIARTVLVGLAEVPDHDGPVDRAVREGSGFLGGAVVDFIDPQWWPIFNVADMAVSIGGVLLVFVASAER